MNFPLLKNAENLSGSRALVRVDFNVPIENGVVKDSFRLERSLPTIRFLHGRCERVILLSHHSNSSQTLLSLAEYLKKYFTDVSFVENIFDASACNGRRGLFLAENIRRHKEEEENDEVFAQRLASLGDVYVNEAFSVSHRNHASIVSVPKFLPHYAGFLFEEEVKHLELAFDPPRPFLFILGGRKAATKLALAKKFLSIADHIFIGGAVANNIFKTQGLEVGTSIVDLIEFGIFDLIESKKVTVPEDVVVLHSSGAVSVKSADTVSPQEKIVDAGPRSLEVLQKLAHNASFVLWNGPLGAYEQGFSESTHKMIKMFGGSKARTIVGGGDTVAAVSSFKDVRFDFLSTGGGAMLQFLSDRTLPGIEALKS